MVWLFLAACILFALGELYYFVIARKRIDALRSYVQEKHPNVFAASFAGAKPSDPKVTDFLYSAENYGDTQLADLKRRAAKAANFGMKPLIFVLGLMVVLYIFSAALALIRGS